MLSELHIKVQCLLAYFLSIFVVLYKVHASLRLLELLSLGTFTLVYTLTSPAIYASSLLSHSQIPVIFLGQI